MENLPHHRSDTMSTKRVTLTSLVLVTVIVLIASTLPSLAQPSRSAQELPPGGSEAFPPTPGNDPPSVPEGYPLAGPVQTRRWPLGHAGRGSRSHAAIASEQRRP